jgi:predicted alpha/beta-hydrolase family hydrolase
MAEGLVTRELKFTAGPGSGEVSALVMRPPDARAMLVLGHGAGAGMRHAFMEAVSRRFADRGLATLRYQFPYIEKGGRWPDPRPVLFATVRAAVATARDVAPDLPLFAGGKSMGGRMTSMTAAQTPLDDVRGIVFLGFPLHPAGRPALVRAAHLTHVTIPMLFLNGTRDKLAALELLKPVCAGLDTPTRLHVVDGADHGFGVLKRSGRTDDDVLDELAEATDRFVMQLI